MNLLKSKITVKINYLRSYQTNSKLQDSSLCFMINALNIVILSLYVDTCCVN